MEQRRLVPELLDSLEATDPRAIRSRRDLRLINAFLGNERWITRQARAHSNTIRHLAELGAGEGTLSKRLHHTLPAATVTGLDLAPRPEKLPSPIGWIRGDFFETLSSTVAETCTGNLILHHFHDEDLGKIGGILAQFRLLIFAEPLRTPLTLNLAQLALPLASDVTKHDMPASIRAGFRPGELPHLLGLDPALWRVEEMASRRGSVRLIASRK
jgi:hypothetical protein